MATVKLLLQQPYKKGTKVLSPDDTRLYAFLILDRHHVVKIKTEHRISPKQWDFRIQGKHERLAGSIEFNKKLAELKEKILNKYKDIISRTPDLPFSQVATVLKEYGKNIEIPFSDNEKGFFEVLDEYIVYLEGEVAPNTIKKYVTLKLSLKEFISENTKYANLTFSLIDHKFLDAYIKYLRNQKPRGRQKTRPEDHQKGLLNDSIMKYVKTIKTFCDWAYKREYNKFNYYKSFEVTSPANRKKTMQEHDIVTLTLSELRQLYTHDFSDNPSYDRVRDLFCFGAFTGQRWSDIEQFSKDQIEGDVWKFAAYKTKKVTEIDLTGYAAPALDILKKYNFELPKISNQKFNDYLKEACREAGITETIKLRRYVGAKEIEIIKPKCEFLSSHSARKTCVSILLNEYNIPITHVLEITGHSDLKTLQKYINKDRQSRRQAMEKTASITEPLKLVKAG